MLVRKRFVHSPTKYRVPQRALATADRLRLSFMRAQLTGSRSHTMKQVTLSLHGGSTFAEKVTFNPEGAEGCIEESGRTVTSVSEKSARIRR